MIRISNIKYPIKADENKLLDFITKKNRLKNIKSFHIVKQSIDARKKQDIHYVYTVDVSVDNESKIIKQIKNAVKISDEFYQLPNSIRSNDKPVIVVGFGPAGMMCAHSLVCMGIKVIVLEQGGDIDSRIKSVEKLRCEGILDPSSNIQFGEGGAGTFSDGKLTTGVNDTRINYILQQFVKHNAPKEIIYKAKPHIGTDKLIDMVKSFREDIIKKNGQIYFNSKLTNLDIRDNKICAAIVNDNDRIETDTVVMATGHSARDTFYMLKNLGVNMKRKVFAIGARIEHKQKMINRSQYGELYKLMPSADYKLAVKTSTGKTAYTFCMCPGGEVVASASEEGGVVTNGMSKFARDGENANSALLVNVNPEDLPGNDILEGCHFQREIEQKAYNKFGGYIAPAQTVGDFLKNNNAAPTVNPTYKPGVGFCSLDDILPKFVIDTMREAIPMMDKKLHGFADDGAVMTAPETRSSSPVRVIRDPVTLQSNITGLYPCGEGAGYAGGIMTAAIDGIKIAEIIAKG